ncbi:uncharacterized protein C8Q71DRAFT_877712 [Rhodofomes roseus]|uniref:Uncharacterized protein n=1 Tax=Rhodofomes roseus TaxID=34475 RepID=A0ABQ8KX97_9APHY|nr:uncharacterized protein C8Q71DRAFT_877712 [Rhodofomes roseus]KAH9842993.1 hypothetical protein C8Q71DRAFT_877712 [Rhodofomes roseus]
MSQWFFSICLLLTSRHIVLNALAYVPHSRSAPEQVPVLAVQARFPGALYLISFSAVLDDPLLDQRPPLAVPSIDLYTPPPWFGPASQLDPRVVRCIPPGSDRRKLDPRGPISQKIATARRRVVDSWRGPRDTQADACTPASSTSVRNPAGKEFFTDPEGLEQVRFVLTQQSTRTSAAARPPPAPAHPCRVHHWSSPVAAFGNTYVSRLRSDSSVHRTGGSARPTLLPIGERPHSVLVPRSPEGRTSDTRPFMTRTHFGPLPSGIVPVTARLPVTGTGDTPVDSPDLLDFMFPVAPSASISHSMSSFSGESSSRSGRSGTQPAPLALAILDRHAGLPTPTLTSSLESGMPASANLPPFPETPYAFSVDRVHHVSLPPHRPPLLLSSSPSPRCPHHQCRRHRCHALAAVVLPPTALAAVVLPPTAPPTASRRPHAPAAS